jgi:hypothetical protein
MADITTYQAGNVSDEGKLNWRGDQVSVAQGGQSIYQSSSVPLAELGSRKVVGDRVFRYARLGAIAAVPGDLLQMPATRAAIAVTAATTAQAGDRVITFFNTAVAATVNQFAEGYIYQQSGTVANRIMYRVKSNASTAADANMAVTLYDPLQKSMNVTDLWQIKENPYSLVTQATAVSAPVAGVLICPATTNDYVWIQTWGPCSVKATTSSSLIMCPAATGAAGGFVATGTGGTQVLQIGVWSTLPGASLCEFAMLQIAP